MLIEWSHSVASKWAVGVRLPLANKTNLTLSPKPCSPSTPSGLYEKVSPIDPSETL